MFNQPPKDRSVRTSEVTTRKVAVRKDPLAVFSPQNEPELERMGVPPVPDKLRKIVNRNS